MMMFSSKTVIQVATVVSVAAAVGFAVVWVNISDGVTTPRHITYIRFLGDLYIRCLSSIVLPLIVASIISVIGGIHKSISSNITFMTLICFISTNIIAAIEGVVLATIIRPGGCPDNVSTNSVSLPLDKFLDLFRNIFSPNIIEATISSIRTFLTEPKFNASSTPVDEWVISSVKVENLNILGVVFFSIITALSVRSFGGKEILEFCRSLRLAMNIIADWILRVSPIGIFSLLAARLILGHDVFGVLKMISWFTLTVFIGLTFHVLVTLPFIFFVSTRQNPLKYVVKCRQGIVKAFQTASSDESLPLSHDDLEKEIHTRVLEYCLPLANLLNKDGTALYKAVAIVFVAQSECVSVNFVQCFIICLGICATCLATPGVPGSSIFHLTALFGLMSLKLENIGLILATDWFLDRVRTCVNVTSNCILTGIINEKVKQSYDVKYSSAANGELTELTRIHSLTNED